MSRPSRFPSIALARRGRHTWRTEQQGADSMLPDTERNDLLRMRVPVKRLIVAVDGSPGDRRVLELVGEWMHQQTVAMTLIYVVEVAQAMPLDAELPAEIATGDAVLNEAEHLARATLGSHAERVTTELLQARSA